MNIPNTYLSIHAIECVKARASVAIGAPVVLTIVSEYGTTQLTLLFRDDDESHSRRLIEAINSVERTPEQPDAAHAAAHDAMAAYAYTMRGDAPPQRPDVPDAERCALDASLPLQGDNV